MNYFKKLIGDRIYLSPRGIEDVQKYTEWMNDFNTTDYIARSAQIVNLESERKYLEKTSNEYGFFSIVTLDNNKLIGTISIENIDYLNRTAVLGIFIGDVEYRGNGYGTEAIQLILDYGFNYLNLNNIRLDLLEFNERALACYTKCGFKEYGRRRKCAFINGTYYDIISMDILSEEFKGSYIKNKNI